MTNNYPLVITLKVPHYGWEIKVFEPTLEENQTIDHELQAGFDKLDAAKLQQSFANILVPNGWNCTDRKGQLLPCNIEGVRQIPQSVFLKMIAELAEALKVGFSDPKPSSASSPTTKAEPGAIQTT
jgi:hypothetical protein